MAIGGNSLIKDKEHQTVRDQYIAAGETCWHIAAMIQDGWNVVIGHGNGPQVGFILRRSELASHELHEVPLDVCGADSQGAIGYALAQNLENDFQRLGIDRHAVAVVTQVEVAAEDPAFAHPSKPIGSFMDEPEASRRRTGTAGRWRRTRAGAGGRVVASPAPLADRGGGRHPVAHHGGLRRDRDRRRRHPGGRGRRRQPRRGGRSDRQGSRLLALATRVDAELLLITTAVEHVSLDFGTPRERPIDRMTLGEAKQYLAEGVHFAEGSMAPKIDAVVGFLERGGGQAIITDPDNVERALAGETGTHVVRM